MLVLLEEGRSTAVSQPCTTSRNLIRSAASRCYIRFVDRELILRRVNVCVLLPLALLCAIFFTACKRRHGHSHEAAYVSAPQAILRDQVAAVYNKMGVVKNGERVDILDRDRRYVKVRTSTGAEGWVEQRYLATQQVFDAFQKLGQDTQNQAIQATGITRNESNIHLTPERNSDHLYQLPEGSKVSMLKRATAPKALPGEQQAAARSASDKSAPAMEDWWLIRDPQGHAGWVLGRMIDVDVPIDVAQYAEGQRIVACFVLDQVPDDGKSVPQYLMLLTEPKDGMAFDYNQLRVFTWNVKRHRYETAYRERSLQGELPVTVSYEDFGKEGNLPVFTIHARDKNGTLTERKYKLNTPIVKRVEEAQQPQAKPAGIP